MPKTILYIHQSSELYGSDKALYYIVKEINSNPYFNAIVLLPNEGPLKDLLEKNNIRVIVFPVIKVSRSFFNFKSIITLPFVVNSGVKRLKKVLQSEKIDIIHSNTLAVFLGAFYAKRNKIKHIWHVHEIINKPKIVSLLYPIIVNHFSDRVVFNSKASKVALCKNNQRLSQKSIINLNGMDRTVLTLPKLEQKIIRKELFRADSDDIVMALVGRISKWKGQTLLLEAFKIVHKKNKNLKLVFVGSAPPNQNHFVEELNMHIDQLNLNEYCKIIPFQENIWKIWDSIDFAVVPSIEPEPFGLVALEAMLAQKPVIAANHGGLKEIVLNNQTGYLFSPNSRDDLSEVIERLIFNKENLTEFGIKGYDRAIRHFSLERHIYQFLDIYQKLG